MIKRIYLLLMLFGGCLFSMRAAVKEEIYVNHIADTVEIGNEFLARKFLVKNDKVRTCMIENKRMKFPVLFPKPFRRILSSVR